MPRKTIRNGTVADAYLALLADRGIDYFFGNAGTDFAPIIESFAKAAATGTPAPKPMLVPHENLALHMALGYYAVSGRPQVVMVHVNAGTANAMCGLINASKGNLPVIFTSGRTPYAETGDAIGLRNREVHWPQEMRDQAAMVREIVKWDYELRGKDVLEVAVDRALNIAMTEPRGPVYMTLPREPLAEEFDEFSFDSPSRRHTPTAPWPDPDAIDQAAEILAQAENPLIITGNSGSTAGNVAALAALAERFALPVTPRKSLYLCLPSTHPMQLGLDPDPYLDAADAILVVDCDVPWIPSVKAPSADCKIIHIGVDPGFSSYPIRGYPADLAITGDTGVALRQLEQAMATREAGARDRIEARRTRVATEWQRLRDGWRATVEKVRDQSPIHPAWLARCIDQVKGENAILVSEARVPLTQFTLTRPGTFFAFGAGGGLGHGLGVALGAKLAAPDRLVICTQGDGSYMYGNPVAAHYVSKAEKLPFLTVMHNNREWGAVKRNTRAIYPDGYAAKSNREPLTFFDQGIEFEHTVRTAGGYGEMVEDPAKLPGALEKAVDMVMTDGRQAMLNVISS